jgi:hypothetical protein
LGFSLNMISRVEEKSKTLVGKPIDQVVAARNDSSQYFRGILA